MYKDSKTRQEYDRKWYQKNKERIRARKQADQSGFRSGRKELIDGIKNVPCADCRGSFPSVCMDFDHVRGEKKFNVGTAKWSVSVEAILEEIKKCEVVCSNCHRIRTANRKQNTPS